MVRPQNRLIGEYGVSKASLYKWWQPYGGMQASELKRINDLEEENARQKRMYDNLPIEFARIAGGQVIALDIRSYSYY